MNSAYKWKNMIKENLIKIFKKTIPMIGVDIGSSSVKMVYYTGKDVKSIKLVSYATEIIPKHFVKDGEFENLEGVGEIVKACWKKLNVSTKDVVIAIPSSNVITKKIIMPFYDNEYDLETQAISEISQYIPFNVDEVSTDFQVLSSQPNKDNAEEMESDVLLVASRKEKINERTAIMEVADLRTKIMDVENFAIQNGLLCYYNSVWPVDQNIVVFDFGGTTLRMWVLRNGVSIYQRDVTIGGSKLTQMLVQHKALQEYEAEDIKRNDIENEEYSEPVLKPFLENVTEEIVRCIHFFLSNSNQTQINEILFLGGASNTPGLISYIANGLFNNHQMQPEINIVNPFQNVMVSEKINLTKLKKESPSLLLASGLAIRSILNK